MCQDTYPTHIEKLELLPTCLLFLHQSTPHQIHQYAFLPHYHYLTNSLTGSNPFTIFTDRALFSMHIYTITYSIAGIIKKKAPL